ncbi:MAG: hypothetical protein U1E56_03265 [Bauldia sp.]
MSESGAPGGAQADPGPAPGRSCGTCGLCCKVMGVSEFNKPNDIWCQYHKAGKGCSIHGRHPDSCRTFYCGWMRMAEWGDDWRPQRCHMVLYWINNGKRLVVHVDPNYPGAWRKSPYLESLRDWSRDIRSGREIVVRERDRFIVILPDREVDLGKFEEDDRLYIGEIIRGSATEYFAEKRKAADPRPLGISLADTPVVEPLKTRL